MVPGRPSDREAAWVTTQSNPLLLVLCRTLSESLLVIYRPFSERLLVVAER